MAWPRLHDVDLNITRRCNLRCHFCSVRVTPVGDPEPELGLAELEELFAELETLGTRRVRIVGGEPFVRRDISEVIAMTADRSFATSILTNGMLMTDRHVEEMVRARVSGVAFSLDGPTAAIHDRSRGSSHAFRRVVEMAGSCRAQGLRCSIMTAITTGVLPHLKELVVFADENGFELLNLIALGLTGRAKDSPDAFPSYGSWKEAVVDLTHFLAAQRFECRVQWLFPHEDTVPRELFYPLQAADCLHLMRPVWGIDPKRFDIEGDDGSSTCLAGKESVTILPNGDVYGCELMRDRDEFRAGNIYEQSLSEIFLESPVLARLRDSSVVRGCASFSDDSRNFSCGQCRAGSVDPELLRLGGFSAAERT